MQSQSSKNPVLTKAYAPTGWVTSENIKGPELEVYQGTEEIIEEEEEEEVTDKESLERGSELF